MTVDGNKFRGITAKTDSETVHAYQ